MRFIKPAAVALTLAMAATAFVPSAEARNNYVYRHGHYGHYHGHNHGGFGAFGAGVAGFAAGAFVGSLAQPRYYGNGYYEQPGYYYAPAPVYAAPRAYYPQPAYELCGSTGVSRPATSMC